MARILAAFAAILVTSISLIALAATTDADDLPQPATAAALDGVDLAKLDPAALKAANERGWVDVIVRSRGEPALVGLSQITNANQRRRSVVAALQDAARSSQQNLLQTLSAWQAAGRVRSVRPFWIFNGLAATVDRQSLLAIAARPDVVSVRLDRTHQLQTGLSASVAPATDDVEWQLIRVRADQVWSGLNVDGRGVVVGIVDTGVDWQHPALVAQYRGYRARGPAQHLGNWIATTGEAIAYPYDGFGHGTAVAGLVLGFDGGRHSGVAPGAQWIAARAFNSDGQARDSWIHAALQWMLAPNGDPSLAPDVVNNSWSSDTSLNPEFRDDVRSLLAAGILPIFAAGNGGPDAGTVAAPASYPESFAVGAVDVGDTVANFSARGPSPFGVVKPNVVAPGLDVVTAAAGGSYQLFKGTSAAAPIAAGIAALVIQAQPTITPTEIARVLTSTALALVPSLPDNAQGWGRVDAYAAVAAVVHSGRVEGRVLDEAAAPIVGATVQAVAESSGVRLAARTDATGRYHFALSPDAWQLGAGAFGYFDAPLTRIPVRTGEAVTHTFQLVAMPTGVVVGRVVDRWSGMPVSATVAISGQAVETRTDATGQYRLTVPVGDYTLAASTLGYRRSRQDVAVTAGGLIPADFDLTPAPRILLVDSGAWYAEPTASIFGAALDGLDYPFATRPITSPARPVTTTELAEFDLVIWSSPRDSPGLNRGAAALDAYLQAGGKVLLSGQDVAYWDDGPGQATPIGYLRRYAHTTFVGEETDPLGVAGTPLSLLHGLTLTLNTADSAGNQDGTDVLAPLDDFAAGIAHYNRAATAVTRSAACLPASVILLGFGLEGSGPATARQAFLARAIEWLANPNAVEFVAALPTQFRAAAPGSRLDGTFRLRNTGRLPQRFDVDLLDGTWPGALLEPAGGPLPQSVMLAPCEQLFATVAVTAPLETPRATSDVRRVTVIPAGNTVLSATLPVTTFTPAPVLLVDHDFVYPSEMAYTTTLSRLNVPFDRWDSAVLGSPTAETLRLYRDVLWFTGYDWHDPVSTAEEVALASFVDEGGRLLLSSQDYLSGRGLTRFAVSSLGVLTYTTDVTAGLISGVAGNPVGDGVGSSPLVLPFSDWSDAVTPTVPTEVAFRDRLGRPVGITHADGARQSKIAFLAFALEGVAEEVRDRVVMNALRWFDPLAASILAVEPDRARPGDDLQYVLTLADLTGAERPIDVDITAAAGVQLRSEGSGDGIVSDGRGGLTWSGTLPAGSTRALRFRGRLNASFRGIATVEAQLRPAGGDALRLQARTRVPFRAFFPTIVRSRAIPESTGW